MRSRVLLFVSFFLFVANVNAQDTSTLSLGWGSKVVCPTASFVYFQVVFVNFSRSSQTIPAGTQMDLAFSAPVTNVLDKPSGTTSSFSGNTLTLYFSGDTTIAAGFSTWVSVQLNLESLANLTPVYVTLTTNPAGGFHLSGGSGSSTVLGLIDNQACQMPVPGTPTVDDLISTCPSAQEISDFNADLTITFDSDPTAGTLVCRAADGSADLTRLQERAYQALRLMRKIPFDTPLPWTSKSLYDWFVDAIQGIRFTNGSGSFCCNPQGVINIGTNNLAALQYSTSGWLASLMVLFVHEARHNEGLAHTCGSGDQTLAELGSWGVQYYLFEWMAFHTGQYMMFKNPDQQAGPREWLWGGAQHELSRFCDLGIGVAASPQNVNFGQQAINRESAAKVVAVTLTKGLPLSVGAVSLSGNNPSDFTIADDRCSGKILPPSCTVLVAFRPSTAGTRSALLHITESGGAILQSVRLEGQGTASVQMQIRSWGTRSAATSGKQETNKTGYGLATVDSGGTPYAIAVLSLEQNGVTVSEAGIPASPPTTHARIFIDFRVGINAVPGHSEAGIVDVNTGIALVNYGSETADVTYTLSSVTGALITTGHGIITAGKHFACFIDQLKEVAEVPDFNLPSDFQTATQFGSLEITSTQPLSVLALRGTMNQRNEFLMTTTPVADLTQSLISSRVYFPQFADGGGYTTTLILLNTSASTERGTLQILDDDGAPLAVNQVGGTADSTFRYSIPSGGAFRFQSDGFPAETRRGWVKLTPDVFNSAPVASGVFGYNPGDVLYSESGIPAAGSTTHARVYVDLSDEHNTGLAIANLRSTAAEIIINAFQTDGVTAAGTSQGLLPLKGNGHDAKFADQFIAGLPNGFTGVLDISSTTPFAALTLRSLMNERHEFLMTTFPVADADQAAPSPMVFPQIADGGGYLTEFILISSGPAASTTFNFYDDYGTPTDFGVSEVPRVCYSNFGPGMTFDTHAWTINGYRGPDTGQQAISNSFIPAIAYRFTDVRIPLVVSPGPPNFSIFLQADSGGLPGAVIEQINVTQDGTTPIVLANSVLKPVLLPNTKYWITVTAAGESVLGGWMWNLIGDTSPFAGTQGGTPAGPWGLDSRGKPRSAFRVDGVPQ